MLKISMALVLSTKPKPIVAPVINARLCHQLLKKDNNSNPPNAIKTTDVRSVLTAVINHATSIPQRLFSLNSSPLESPVSAAGSFFDSRASEPHIDKEFAYVYGRSTKQLKYETVADIFNESLARETQTTACVVYDEGISKTFEQLNDDVNKLVVSLIKKLKLKRGDKVGIYSFNCYQWLLVQYACNKLGLALFAINPAYKADELAYVLSKANLKALFMPGKNSSQVSLNDHWSIFNDNSIRQLNLKNLSNIVLLDGELDTASARLTLHDQVQVDRWHTVFSQCGTKIAGNTTFDETISEAIGQVCPDDIYGIYQTSGTTGYPKGAVISQFTAINNTKLAMERLFYQRAPEFGKLRHNICLPLPLFHEFAGVLGILSPFCVQGGSFVLTGKKYDIESVVKAILRFKCNVLFLTPTILIDLLAYVERQGPELAASLPLKMICGAGSMVLPEIVAKAYKSLPSVEQFVIMYGSSEHGVLASVQSTNEPRESRPFTVGTPVDFTEIRIASPETNQIVRHGESGEIQTRGYNTMIGYYEDPEKTAGSITRSRWFKTGDLGAIDPETGSLRIVGRAKDLIIKGGENVYPAEIERVLHLHPAIADAQVFGIPDERLGEEVSVWIRLRDAISAPKANSDADCSLKAEIVDFCKSKLTYFKVPKARYMRFVTEYPLTAVKKIKKYEMRAQMVQMLADESKLRHQGGGSASSSSSCCQAA